MTTLTPTLPQPPKTSVLDQVNPDVIEATRRHIAVAEQRLLLEAARTRLPMQAPKHHDREPSIARDVA